MKKALLSTIVMLIISITLLAGSTFAWFSVKQVSNNNTIQFGTFDMELMIRDTESDEWLEYVPDKSLISQTDEIVIEPGAVITKEILVKNNGTIDFAFSCKVSNFNHNLGTIEFEYKNGKYYPGEYIYVTHDTDDTIIKVIYTIHPFLNDLKLYSGNSFQVFDIEYNAIQVGAVSNFVKR